MVNLDPAQGDTLQVRSAATRIRGYSQGLVNDRRTANNQTAVVDGGSWTGLAADSFSATMSGLSAIAAGVVDGWDRLASALDSYATQLENLQEEADATLERYRTCDQRVATAQRNLTRAESSGTGATGLTGELTSARLARAQVETEITDIESRRTALDEQIATLLLEAPGGSTSQWRALTTGADGRRLTDQQIIDNILEILNDGTVTTEDLDLLRQFLLQHGSNPDMCDKFFTALGAEGFVELQEAVLAVTPVDDEDFQRARDLISALNNGLALASQQWSPATCKQYGSDLIDSIKDAESSAMVTVPGLLATSGLNPYVGLGSMERLEHIRTHDPVLFEKIGLERDPLTLSGDAGQAAWILGTGAVADLATSIFTNLSLIPAEALTFFGNPESAQSAARTDYWFYERDWSVTGFEAPTGLLSSMTSSPALQAGRYSADSTSSWASLTSFVSRAFEGLGANPNYTMTTTSATAKLNIVNALTPYMAEIAAQANGTTSEVTRWIFTEDGKLATITLSTNQGNLARVLGVALTDPGALRTYGTALNIWQSDVIAAINEGRIPADSLSEALSMIGSAQGLASAYGAEIASHASAVSEAHRQQLDLAFALLSLVPSVETGYKIADYVSGVVSGNMQGVLESLDPQILSPDQIRQLSTHPRTTAGAALRDSLATAFDLSDELTAQLGNSPESEVYTSYDTASNAFTQLDSTGSYSIVPPGGASDPTVVPIPRGDMP